MTITFICTGNTCRSAMAEGICRKMLSDRKIKNITCRSCGLAAFTGDSASPNAVAVTKEMGVDISNHRATVINQYILDETDVAVCMTERHKQALMSVAHKGRILVPQNEISDPYGGDLETYRRCALELKAYIEKLLDVLTAELVPMDENHIEGIAELEKLCFSSPWTKENLAEELENENSHFLAAVSDNNVLGYIGVQEVCGEAYITNVAVYPKYRRMGLGKSLLSRAGEDAKARNCQFISLEVRKSNTSAIELYRKQGYNVAGERKNFYSNPSEDGLIMTKSFKD